MKFTTGQKEIEDRTFAILREQNSELLNNLNIEEGKYFGDKQLYNNVPADNIKIGEKVYKKNGAYYGYRSE